MEDLPTRQTQGGGSWGTSLSANQLDDAVRIVFRDSDADAEIAALFPSTDDQWAISRTLGQFVARLVLQLGRRSVLEFGAGRSSLILATSLARAGGGRLTSVEHQPEFSRDYWTLVQGMHSVDSRLIVTELRMTLSRHGLMYGYPGASRQIAERAPYDLLIVDAPPGEYGRDAPVYDAYSLLADGAIVVLDDAARNAERTAVRRWLETFPGLRLALLDTTSERGTAVLIYSGGKRRRFAARAILGTFHDRWHRRRSSLPNR